MTKYLGFGLDVQIGDSTDNASSSWEDFSQIVEEPSGPNTKATIIDVTDHQNQSNFKEKLQGLVDGGQVTFTMGFDPADSNHRLVHSLQANRQSRDYRIVNPDDVGSYYQFTAWIEELGQAAPIEGLFTKSVTLSVTGVIEPTWTPA